MIYLDHNATTPIAPEVFEAMRPYLTFEWGNPSSPYSFGSKLKSVIEKARERVAALIGCEYPGEVLFTSCATESNATAIHAAITKRPNKRHIITSTVEHSSVLAYYAALEHEGYTVTYLPVNRDGLLTCAEVDAAISESTALVSLMWANNETGVLFPIETIAQTCKARGVLFHCDAVQAVGKLPISVNDIPIDYLSLSGHKIHAPKGVGALYIHRKAPFSPFLNGGHQERGRRGGTENVALISGLGTAAELAITHISAYDRSVRPLRDILEKTLMQHLVFCKLNGHCTQRLPNTTNISFDGIAAEALLLLLDEEGICASSGSACLADSKEASHVIRAMHGKTHTVNHDAIRFSLGIDTSHKDIMCAIQTTIHAAQALHA